MPHPNARVSTRRETLAEALTTYGEDAVAARIPELPQAQYDCIEMRAFDYACQGMYIAKALSLAAVEVVEGSPRPLKRKRRKFPR
jgi:hypothetical protein